jgi:hypothetical protein
MHMAMPHKREALSRLQEKETHIKAEYELSCYPGTPQVGILSLYQFTHSWQNHSSQSSNAHGHALKNKNIQ